jgi:hypothetical protein
MMPASMRAGTRADLVARALLTVAAVLPYWRLLTFAVIFVTDDYFASDVFNGELPARVMIGRMIRHGQLPVWTDRLCSGLPLVGTAADPIGLASFALLPPAPALDLLVLVLLLVAAHGTYSLARRFGADRTSAVLAGVAFAGSGYIACQLKHLAIVSTVVWLPVGLLLLDRVMDGGRNLAAAAFGLVFANQALSGFPQSAYISGLVYVAFALFRGVERRDRVWHAAWGPLVRAGIAMALGGAAGAIVLLPLSALGAISDRVDAGWVWATRLAYWPPNALMFLFPYAHGDISNNTYDGPPFFWEDYGYVGLATVLLAFYGAIRERRRPPVTFAIAMTLVSYLFVLGPATPVYRVVYLLIPGMSTFRFPTRFLIVVDLGLAVLGAIGLTRLRADLQRWTSPTRAAAIAVGVCVLTVADLTYHQPRQNPIVSAREWLAPPETVRLIAADTPEARTFTPRHRDLHRATFQAAHGWSDTAPYFAMRDLLEPNLGGGLWGTPSGDCYAGISARWYVDVWGDHNRELSLMTLLSGIDPGSGAVRVNPHLAAILRAYGVTHVLSPRAIDGLALVGTRATAHAFLYRIPGTARAWFVAAGHPMTDADAAKRLLDPGFDPDHEVLLQDTVDGEVPAASGDASVGSAPLPSVTASGTDMTIDADAPANGFLVIADTFYPGWTAEVDGTSVPIYRANLSVRAIPVTKGHHVARLHYDAPSWRTGLAVSGLSIAALFGWLLAPSLPTRRPRGTSAPVPRG